jgi:outer membrane protein OmpA-like peptidoglycan-associated protein
MMMKLFACIVIALLIGGCQSWQSKPQSAPVPPSHSKYQFDYKVTNGEPIGLVRAFDDGGSTYYQFRGNPPEALVVSAETTNGEAIIPHEIMGNYAVIRGVYRSSSVPAAVQSVMIQKLGAIAPMASMGPVILPKVATHSAPKVEPAPLPVAVENPPSNSSSIRQIRFRRNSALLGPVGRKTLNEMVVAGQEVGDVEIRVRPFYPNRRASVQLAKSRAKAIRQILIDAGIGESRVRISSDRGTAALVAEVEIRTMRSQATNDPFPVRSGFEHLHNSALGVEFNSPTLPKSSAHI